MYNNKESHPIETHPKYSIGKRLTLIREDGVEFLDAVSGTFNLSLGYDHSKIVQAVSDQLNRCIHMSSTYSAPYAQDVLNMLTEVAPDNIQTGWMRDITGSTANECAVKIAMKNTGRKGILSCYLSHHGQTTFASLMSGQNFRIKSFPIKINANMYKVNPPYCYRCPYGKTYPNCSFMCAEKIHDVIVKNPNKFACVIIEPVFGNGGNIVPPKAFFKALSKICRETGVLLIADEVQTGMGRTGEIFACQLFDIKANIITLAKGLGGIGIPIAAVLMENKLNTLKQYEHSFTSGGYMLGLAAAEATIEVIREPAFLAHVRSNGKFLEKELSKLKNKYKCVGDVRGVGMMWGIEIVDDAHNPDVQKTNQIIHCAEQDYRLILRGSSYGFGNVVKVRPALIANEDELDDLIGRLSKAIKKVEEKG